MVVLYKFTAILLSNNNAAEQSSKDILNFALLILEHKLLFSPSAKSFHSGLQRLGEMRVQGESIFTPSFVSMSDKVQIQGRLFWVRCWSLIRAAGAPGKFRTPVIIRLSHCNDSIKAGKLCGTSKGYFDLSEAFGSRFGGLLVLGWLFKRL